MAGIDVLSAFLTTFAQAQTLGSSDAASPPASAVAALGLGVLCAFARWAAYLLGMAADIHLVGADLEGRPLSAREGWSLAGRHFWMFLGLTIVVALVVCFGFFALVVPGIYLAVRFSVSSQALLLERKDVGDALARSGELVRGHFWRAIALMILVAILTTILSLPSAGISVLSIFFVDEEGGADLGFYVVLAIGQLATVLVTTVLSPLAPAVFTHFYADLRVREAAGGATPPPAPRAAEPIA